MQDDIPGVRLIGRPHAGDGPRYEVVEPATGRPIGHVAAGTGHDAARAVDVAAAALDSAGARVHRGRRAEASGWFVPPALVVPFGGRGDSGIGYEGGLSGLLPFLAHQSIATLHR
ncbi:hypothetical protein ABZ897_53495 [Nonomuraea sp. NPDC046802]|uniref:hypothetical protein n=1 Tax=Nonomuraea sp. NPDC046802 TaxID=3154919 RepID=UPI0033D37898